MIDLSKLGMGFLCKEANINPVGNYIIEDAPAKNFVTKDRIDLLAKINYIKAYETGLNNKYALGLYKRNIEACTMGMFYERGNDKKKSFGDFVRIFDEMIENIRMGG